MSDPYNEKIGNLVCELIADGLTIDQLRSMPLLPPVTVLRGWLYQSIEFKVKYQDAIMDRIGYDYDLLQEWLVLLLDPAKEVPAHMLPRIKLAKDILVNTMELATNVVTGRSSLNSAAPARLTVEFVNSATIKQIEDSSS